MKNKSYHRIQSVAKAMEIVEFLADQTGPVKAMEISRALGYKIGSVFSLIYTMIDCGFLEETAQGFVIGAGAAKPWANRCNRMKSILAETRSELSRISL